MSSSTSKSNVAGHTGGPEGAARPAGWPGALPLDVDGYPASPPGLELQQVHVYIRHGERTPVGIRMAEPPASIPEHWMLCKTARHFKAAVASSINVGGRSVTGDDETLNIRKVVERADGSVADGECLLGELTDIGRQSTYNFGHALRRLYIDKLGFLPDVLSSNDEAYFRTTNIPRTTESLEHIIHGLYPTEKCAPGFLPPLLIRNGRDENLFGNTLACKRLEILQIGFAQAAAQTWNTTLEPLDEKVSKYIGGNPIRLDGKPRASGVLDTIKAATAHGIHVPSELREKGVIDVIERAVVQEWFAGYKTEEVRRLGMGPLLSDLSRKMSSKAKKGPDDPMRILIHSTHDTAIAGLCSTLDIFDERWPAFSAAVTFELFSKRTTEDPSTRSIIQTVLSPFWKPQVVTEHFVRTRYQNRNMALPICAEEGKHLPGSSEFCTLAAFMDRIKELTPVDWEKECSPVNRTTKAA
ncbi:phosphoglycerate mutase-like protein [Cristinia sonorae]|uniref:Phosphoglycerate mutase-like protein n=1 Tax=Cristinia sonorae TaxID=1940300 RepID=A0A8K0XR49_9AGAR|nr:phosphoglycerate mutase-like protein [Cristinia sonorae]